MKDIWHHNGVQFARLLTECRAVLTRQLVRDIGRSMDLLPGQVEDLFIRAKIAFDREKKLRLKACELGCGRYFWKVTPNQRYCSPECSAQAQRANNVRRVQKFRKRHMTNEE